MGATAPPTVGGAPAAVARSCGLSAPFGGLKHSRPAAASGGSTRGAPTPVDFPVPALLIGIALRPWRTGASCDPPHPEPGAVPVHATNLVHRDVAGDRCSARVHRRTGAAPPLAQEWYPCRPGGSETRSSRRSSSAPSR